jgi:hypothetical protein
MNMALHLYLASSSIKIQNKSQQIAYTEITSIRSYHLTKSQEIHCTLFIIHYPLFTGSSQKEYCLNNIVHHLTRTLTVIKVGEVKFSFPRDHRVDGERGNLLHGRGTTLRWLAVLSSSQIPNGKIKYNLSSRNTWSPNMCWIGCHSMPANN